MQIRNDYGLWVDNEKQMKSCKEISGDKDLHVNAAVLVIMRALWDMGPGGNCICPKCNKEVQHQQGTP